MSKLLKDLKKYFETTSREKVLENWSKSEKYDNIGPKMDEHLRITNKYHRLTIPQKINL